jgi:hypothetical protein
MRYATALFMVLCVCATGSIQAADEQGRFVVKGAGMTSCAQFAEAAASRDVDFVSYAGWLEGFFSALNRYETQTYDLVSWQGTELLMASLARYCSRNPDVSFHDAAFRMANQLKPTGLTEKSPVVAIPLDQQDKSVLVYAVVIQRLQQRLNALGLYAGETNGQFNDATRDALRTFQANRQLPQTGAPDQATLAHLLR